MLRLLKNKWVVLLITASLLFWSIVGYTTFKNVTSDLETIQTITDNFLFHTSTENYATAYLFMSDKIKKEISFDEFKESITYPKGIYQDINDVTLTSFQYFFYTGQPITLNYKGDLLYDDRTQGIITATYVKENGQWKIESIWIYAEPARIKKFQK